MLQRLILLIFALLIVTSNSQCTAYPSTLNYMVTGVVEMGSPVDTFAKDDYNVLFSGSQTLGTYANIFTAFCTNLSLFFSHYRNANIIKSKLLLIDCRSDLFIK